MLNLVMAFARRDELAFARVWVVDVKREVWAVAQMLNMMDNKHTVFCSALAFRAAILTFVPVEFFDLSCCFKPFCPEIKLMFLSFGEKGFKLGKSIFCYHHTLL